MKEVRLVRILSRCYTMFFDRYKVGDLTEEHGYKVLRLPPYQCHFNPIELGWSQAKRYYNSNIG
jgi:hypothetical protein